MTPSMLKRISDAVGSIRYGAVHILIQDSKVIQIEKIEKVRLDKADRETGGTSHSSSDPTRHLEAGQE